MPRLESIDQLAQLRRELADKSGDNRPGIVICAGTACQASGSGALIRAAKRYILENHLVDRVCLRVTGCHGFCEMGPFVLAEPQNAFYAQVKPENLPRAGKRGAGG